MTVSILLMVGGFLVLLLGAEALVRGASKLAIAAGLSPLVVGLTVVALGTSAPELTVSVSSAWRGQSDIAIGNVVGSNIFNTLVILGLSAAITPLAVARRLVRMDVPLMLGAACALWVMSLDGDLQRWEAGALFAGFFGYMVHTVRQARREQAEEQGGVKPERSPKALAMNLGFIAAGLGLLVLGSRWLVDGAVVVARAMGVSELIIGLTIIAAGTSLPELATSAVAAARGQRDIAVGNVVGSNLFNILAVLGITGMVAPRGVPVPAVAVYFDIPVMVATAAICLPIFFTGARISRLEGLLLLGYYGAYSAYLTLNARGHDALGPFSDVMLYAVLPLSGLVIAMTLVHAFIERARTRSADKTIPPASVA